MTEPARQITLTNPSEVKPGNTVRAHLIGGFRLTGPEGADLTPQSAKARGLLALLLMSPGYAMTRDQIAGLLWSDRSKAQAQNSLRNTLTEIRSKLDAYGDLFVAGRQMVSLDRGQIGRDLDRQVPSAKRPFLAGVKVKDKAFVTWVEQHRAQLQSQDHGADAPLVQAHKVDPEDTLHGSTLMKGYCATLADWCAQAVVEEVDPKAPVDAPAPEIAPTYVLESHLEAGANGVAVQMSLCKSGSRQLSWQMPHVLPSDPTELMQTPHLFRLINSGVDRTLLDFGELDPDLRARKRLQRGTFDPMRRIFRNRDDDLELARQHLDDNFAANPRGIYLAWSAYSLTMYRGERDGQDHINLMDEAEELAAHALELEPANSMVLALCSYVHTYLLGNKIVGHDLASRSLRLNPSNPLAWAFRGAAHFNSADNEAAYRDIMFARKISGDGPYRYVIEAFSCVASILTNRLEEATRYGELSANLSPRYRAPLRYLSAIYAAQQNEAALQNTLRKLHKIEPAFNLQLLQETSYPMQSLRNSKAYPVALLGPPRR